MIMTTHPFPPAYSQGPFAPIPNSSPPPAFDDIDYYVRQHSPSWSHTSSASTLYNVHYGLQSPISTSFTGTASSVLSSPFTFNPSGTFKGASWSIDSGGTSTMSCNVHRTVSQGGNPPSLDEHYQSIGDASASPLISRDTFGVTSIADAEVLIQRVTTPADVEVAVLPINTWLKSLPHIDRQEATRSIRLKVIRLFTDAWTPTHDNHFLDFDEHDVFVMKKLLPLSFMDSVQLERLSNTVRGTVVAMLVGRLLQLNVMTSSDVALACELLLTHYRRDGYMQGLHMLLGFAGDKVCRLAALGHMMKLVNDVEAAKCEEGLYEVTHYADSILEMIHRYASMQAMKQMAALPKGRKRNWM